MNVLHCSLKIHKLRNFSTLRCAFLEPRIGVKQPLITVKLVGNTKSKFEILRKGDYVIASGFLSQRNCETQKKKEFQLYAETLSLLR